MLRSIATRIGNSGAWCFMFRSEVGIPSKYRPRFWHARHSGHVCPLNQLIHFGDRVSVGGLDKLKDTARGSVLCCAVYATGVSSASSVLLPLESTQHILNRSRQIHNGRDPIQSEDEWLWIVSVGFFRATGGLDSGVRNQQPYLLLVINSRWLSFTTCSGNYSLHVFERNAIWDRFIPRVSEVDQDDSRVHIPKITFGV